MRNVHYRTWNMARNLKHVENEQKYCMTWNMARNTKKLGNEKCMLQEMEYAEKTD